MQSLLTSCTETISKILSGETVNGEAAPVYWQDWLRALFPSAVSAPFAQRHIEFWEWVEAIEKGIMPKPFVALWPRGGGKSTNVELSAIRLGAKDVRTYIWYTSSTQEKADKHVESIALKLESPTVARYYPDLAKRKVGKYGSAKGWRRQRLWTASGFTIDALGIDTGARGAKADDRRPDLIILDDIDERNDTPKTTYKKIDTISQDVLPAGSNDVAVMFAQNLIHPDSIASRLSDGRADFLLNRTVSGPFPAVIGLTHKQVEDHIAITGGVPTWEGQNLEVCQSQINLWGLTSFLKESQHQVENSGGIWEHIEFRYCDLIEVPELVRGCVWLDPAVTSTDESDCQGIEADGIDVRDIIYRMFSWEGIDTPENALRRAIMKAIEYNFDHVGVETDQGGDTWYSVYMRVCEQIRREKPKLPYMPSFMSDKAGAGYGSKIERNARMLVDYEHGMVIHVRGTHTMLDRALRRFPNKPLDLADVAFWTWTDLRNGTGGWASGAAE